MNGSGWAVVILCMRQSFFFVNGGVRVVGAVKATSKQHITAGLKCHDAG